MWMCAKHGARGKGCALRRSRLACECEARGRGVADRRQWDGTANDDALGRELSRGAWDVLCLCSVWYQERGLIVDDTFGFAAGAKQRVGGYICTAWVAWGRFELSLGALGTRSGAWGAGGRVAAGMTAG
jgi:hypothetical protein